METFSLSLKVDDGNSGYDTLDFNITVNNTPPNFIGSPISSVYEDSLYSYDLNVDDESSGLVTYSLIINPGWLSINSSNGLLSGTPLNNHVGDNSVKVTADDGHDGTDTLEFIISVVNTPPQITTSPPNTAQEDIRYSVNFNCTDEGQGSIIYSALKKPSWLSLNQGTGLLTGIALNNDVTNEDSIKIMVSDGRGGYDTLAYTISVINTAPHITSIFQDTTITEDESFSFDINSDDEGQGEIEYTFISDVPSWISIDTLSGVISGIPLNNHIVDSLGVNVKVDDGNDGVGFGTFYITVLNNPPNFVSVIDSIATENVLFTYDADTDDEGQGNVFYSLIGSYPNWLSYDDSTGVLSGTPINDDVDTSLVTIRFSDGNGGTIEQVFHLIVENVNDSPYMITNISQDTSPEDILWEMTFTAGDSDLIHGDSLQFLLADNPLGMSIDPDSGKVTWVPDNSFVGDNSFYVIVEDLALTRDSLYFNLHVNNVNDKPWIIAQNDTVAVEDSLFNLAVNAVDIDLGDTITFEIVSAPDGMTINDSSGIISWIPDNSHVGQWEVITRVYDLSITAADTDTFYVDVENANDPPIINKDIVTADIYEDSLWTFQFYALDDDSSYGEKLTFELNNNPLDMTIIDTTGFIQWTPLNENVGQDSFVVYVQDRSLATDSLKFYLTIVNTNDSPQIAAIQDTIAYEDSLFRFTVQYTDVDVGDSIRFSLVISPDSMTIDSLSGTIEWTPLNDDRDSNFVATVYIKDGMGATDSVTFNIFVNDINDPPILSDLNIIEFIEDSSYIMQYSAWFDSVEDIDDADSVLTWEILPFENVVFQEIVDTLVFSAPLNWFGLDTSKAIISDGELNDTTELVIHVLPVNDFPIITQSFPDTIDFPEDDTTYLDLNQYVSDVDNDILELNWSIYPFVEGKNVSSRFEFNGEIYRAITKEHKKNVSRALGSYKSTNNKNISSVSLVNSDGDSITIEIDTANVAKFYTMPDFYIYGFQFLFVVDDSIGQPGFGSDSTILTVTVSPVNDAPVLDTIPSLAADEDSTIFLKIEEWYDFVNDVDDLDSTLLWTINQGNHSAASLMEDSLMIVPDLNWFGIDTLKVIVSDGRMSDTTDLLVEFKSVNDFPEFSQITDTSLLEDDTLFISLNEFIYDVETSDGNLVIEAFEAGQSQGKAFNSNGMRNHKRAITPGKEIDLNVATINSDFPSSQKIILRSSTSEFSLSQDSIAVEIDESTHIVSIYGTPNFYTEPISILFYVYDDSLDYDSISVDIGIEPVNDKPELKQIPMISFREDSTYNIYLSQWDSLVYDVEEPDSILEWSFETGGNVEVQYDIEQRLLTLMAGPNLYCTDVMTAVVSDQEGLSDTVWIDIEVLQVNDPPLIDSSLFSIHYYQNDTVIFNLDDFVTDVDNDVGSLVWNFNIGDSLNYSFIDSTRILQLWAQPDWFGLDSIIATVSDSLDSSDTQMLYVTVIDSTPPSFEIGIFQNVLISKWIDVNIYPSEKLSDIPLVTFDGDTGELEPRQSSTGFSYYYSTYQIEKTGEIQIVVDGKDRAGNRGIENYVIGVCQIYVESGGVLTGPNEILSFLFSPNSIKKDICALVLPTKEGVFSDTTVLGKIVSGSDSGEPVSEQVEFVAPVRELESEARLLFNFADLDITQPKAVNLGLYYYENDKWKYIKTYTSLETGAFWAYSKKVGIYQIRTNPMHPAILLPKEYIVSQNYPNPFNSNTIINYTIGAGEFRNFDEALIQLTLMDVSIRVYNILGQEVKTLVNEPQLPGFYTVTWDGRNNYGRRAATGIYIYLVIIGEKVFNKKMTILK